MLLCRCGDAAAAAGLLPGTKAELPCRCGDAAAAVAAAAVADGGLLLGTKELLL
jgi:hypothetical protein